MWFNQKKGKIKMKKIIFAIFFLCFSCGTTDIPLKPRKKGKQKELLVYLESYKQLVPLHPIQKKRIKRLHMNILPINAEKKDGSTIIGRCWYYGSGDLEIVISKDFWENPFTTVLDKEFVVYHELEHCVRYRSHTNARKKVDNIIDFFERLAFAVGFFSAKQDLPDGCPASLMNSSTMSAYCQNQHYIYYINEMKYWRPD